MTGKVMILVLMGVLCTAQSAVAKPSDLFLSQGNLLDNFALPQISNILPTLGNGCILDKIQELVKQVEKTFEELSGKVQEAVKNGVAEIENRVQKETEKLTEQIQELVDKANASGVDVQKCINESRTKLEELGENLRDDAETCLSNSQQVAQQAIQNVKDLNPVAQQLLSDAVEVVQNCTAPGQLPTQTSVCLAQKLPPLGIRLTRLTVDYGTRVRKAAAAVANILPSAASCFRESNPDVRNEVDSIIQNIISCIEGTTNSGQ